MLVVCVCVCVRVCVCVCVRVCVCVYVVRHSVRFTVYQHDVYGMCIVRDVDAVWCAAVYQEFNVVGAECVSNARAAPCHTYRGRHPGLLASVGSWKLQLN